MVSRIGKRSDQAALSAELAELMGVVEPGAIADMLLQRAFSSGVTDIHMDSVASGLRIRFRIDGKLQDIIPVPTAKASNIISRIKILANMDITERRLPQDGRISSTHVDGIDRDVRVGTMSTIYGERIVMRLMPDPTEFTSLDSLGMYDDQLQQINRLLQAPYGLVLVVGPVGAGKTTTLYNFVATLNRPDRSIVTIEDPVERRLPGSSQIQVDNKSGLTFPVALRGILRQDPNVMCIGEIRDAETAKIAARAATTGVLVMSTLHANDTSSAVEVMRQFGIPSMVIADSLRAVISQRLIHVNCQTSRKEIEPDAEARKLLQLPDDDTSTKIVEGVPAACNFNTGYAGRTAIFETMLVGRNLREAIHREAATYEISDAALADGMISLEEAARRRVLDHTTSMEELIRIKLDASLS